MNEKTNLPIKVGGAVLTDLDGTTRSVRVTFVDNTGAKCVWQTGRHNYACRFVPCAEFSRLQMFADGEMFVVLN